jgi:hypothetical protein
MGTVMNSAQVIKEKQLERSNSQLLVQNPGLMEKIMGPAKQKTTFLMLPNT